MHCVTASPRIRTAAAIWLILVACLLHCSAGQPEPCISTVAGNGGTSAAPLSPSSYAILTALAGPIVMTVDPASNTAFVAEFNRFAIRRIDLASGLMWAIAGTGSACQSGSALVGPAASTFICSIADLHYDAAGNSLLWADSQTHTIRAVNLTTSM